MLCRLWQLAARPPAEPIRKGVICAAKLKLITPRLSSLVRAAANQFPITPRASGALGVSPFGKSPHPLFFVFYGFRKAVNYRKKPRADDIRPYTVQCTSAAVFLRANKVCPYGAPLATALQNPNLPISHTASIYIKSPDRHYTVGTESVLQTLCLMAALSFFNFTLRRRRFPSCARRSERRRYPRTSRASCSCS